ncbi:hypothetical protein [Vulgatibacter sp.]|uniref:hypothetical protein n=1 Tax=Vulgatibacter sp. TaxID=1971226 RepID=UPI0035664CEF
MAAVMGALLFAYGPRRLVELPLGLPVLALALAGPIAVWAIGGLEQPLLAALLSWAAVLLLPELEAPRRSRLWTAGGLLALLCLTRPDGPLFTATFAAALVLAGGFRRTAFADGLRLALPSAGAVGGQLAFRLLYYGDWVVNTARAKVAFSFGRFADGASYVGDGLLWLGGLTALALLGVVAAIDRRHRYRTFLLLVPLLAWLCYVAAVGGDIFPARRHLVPAVVLLALLAAEGLRWLCARGPRAALAGGVAGLTALIALGFAQSRDPENDRAIHERWEWDGLVLGNLLQEAFAAQRPLVAVDAAGTIPYFSRLPALDMLGLNDRFLASNPPPDFGKGFLGHELGNGAYVLSRAPDIVVMCLPTGSARGCFRSGKELVADPAFRQAYQLVNLKGREPHRVRTLAWVRKEGRIGIRREEGLVEIPGLLFATGKRGVARLDSERVLRGELERGAAARVHVELGAGSWRVRAVGTGRLRLVLRPADRAAAAASPARHADGEGGLIWSGPAQKVDVLVRAGKEPARIERIVFERITDADEAR